MNKALLDTQAWFWLVTGEAKFPENLRPFVQKLSDENCLFLSEISPWEIALKESLGKIKLSRPISKWMKTAVDGLELISLHIDITIEATRLPGDFHKDPADRFIVASCRVQDLVLITADEAIKNYAKFGYVDVIGI